MNDLTVMNMRSKNTLVIDGKDTHILFKNIVDISIGFKDCNENKFYVCIFVRDDNMFGGHRCSLS